MTPTSRPFFSVVVPLYNGASYVNDALDSLAAQTFDDFEVVVVDDGSTDDGAEVAASHGVGARVVHQRNLGVACARNRGIAEASGRFVGFLDQDDLWHPDRLADVRRAIEDWPEQNVFATREAGFGTEADRERFRGVAPERASMVRIWAATNDLLGELVERCPPAAKSAASLIAGPKVTEGAVLNTSGLVCERQLLITAGCYPTFTRSVDDYLLSLVLAFIDGIVMIERDLVYYRLHSGAVSSAAALGATELAAQVAVRRGRNFVATPRLVDDWMHLHHLRGLMNEAPGDVAAMGWLLYTGRDRATVLKWALKGKARRAMRRLGAIAARSSR